MEPSAKPLINPAVVWDQVPAGEALLLNLDTAACLALNHTGVVVWQLVDGKRSVQQIIAAVQRHFNNVPDAVADDVSALLDTLAEDGFIGTEWMPGDETREP